MPISPMDIHLKEFSAVSAGGYEKEEVDSFMDTVADELEKLLNRVQELEDKVDGMGQKVSQFDNMQQTLQNALMNAQKSAGNILQEARSQAGSIIKKAQERNDRIIDDMQREKERILSTFSSMRVGIIDQIPYMRELLEKSIGLLQEYETYTIEADLEDKAEEAELEAEPPAPGSPPDAAEAEEEPGEEADAGEPSEVEEEKPAWG